LWVNLTHLKIPVTKSESMALSLGSCLSQQILVHKQYNFITIAFVVLCQSEVFGAKSLPKPGATQQSLVPGHVSLPNLTR